MKKEFLLIILLLIFISGCVKEDVKLVEVYFPESDELNIYAGNVTYINYDEFGKEEFTRYFQSPPKGYVNTLVNRYVLRKDIYPADIDIEITSFENEEDAEVFLNKRFNEDLKLYKSLGHNFYIFDNFNFINNDLADTVKAFYYNEFNTTSFILPVTSHLYVRKGGAFIHISENLDQDMKSIGQENIEKIAELVLLKNDFRNEY